MQKMEPGKQYLIVWCKKCHKGMRVLEEPVMEGKTITVKEPKQLTCRGCGHKDTYAPEMMRVATMSDKPPPWRPQSGEH